MRDAFKPSIKRARQILMSVQFVVMAFESSHKNRAPLRDKFISVQDYDFNRRDKVSISLHCSSSEASKLV